MWLELSYATPYLPQDDVLDFILEDCILQANDIRHKILDIRLALLCGDKLSTLLQLQWTTFLYHGSTIFPYLQNCPVYSTL